ncbi:cAMP-binding domain of CRP or a regulatory subunit of cAMP-dependent protein kinases [Mariniphaga anaerophila]|uniref:cAMP-binding domain of CRP or a regulatory subunit of cAMP-dependent protein kinases n=1 Tax=Mariniphaga anaerophila TaxID=1484053 RepID=A0A1M5BJR8_9BACT|nr:Crp/Fnr family transcriptional regulator [Mariniphaga anaerophila]SHF42665.1 cAMP-binding domain of CRP or a regulatory subunit of cAMP-dependent protein kinases [Mariniphaga anaerophila]
MIDYKLLEQCPVFEGVSESEIRNILNGIHYQVKKYKKGDVVVVAGEPVVYLFVVLSGSVKGEMVDYSGKTIKIEDIEAPRPLATAFLFGKRNRFPVIVTANNEVRMLAIHVPEFLKLLQNNVQVLKNYLDSISSRSQFLSQKLQFLSFKTIRGKMAHFLLQQAGDRLHSFPLKSTQQQLSELFGVTRPSLARVLSEMQKEKLFAIEKRTVTLLDKKRLNDILRNG